MNEITKTDNFIFFWHLGERNEKFHNWYHSDFTLEGIKYCCVEQYMMAKKALMFSDLESYTRIMNSSNPEQIKAFGRLVKNFKPEIWDSAKDEVVYNACYAKFSQNEELKKLLISTEGCTIAEASPDDAIWGIGLAEDHPDAKDPGKWPGEGRLGTIIEKVRRKLADNK